MEHLYSYQPQVTRELRTVGASVMPSMRETMKKKRINLSTDSAHGSSVNEVPSAPPASVSGSRPFHTGKVRGQHTEFIKSSVHAVDEWNRKLSQWDRNNYPPRSVPVQNVPQKAQAQPRFGRSAGVTAPSACAHAISKRVFAMKPEELVCLDTVILFELIRMDALVVHEGMVFIQRKRVSNVTTKKTDNSRFNLILDEIAHSVCMHSHHSGSPIYYVPYIPTSMKLSQMNPYMKVITREGVKDTKKRLSSLSTMTKRSTIRDRFLREIGIDTITSDIPQYNLFESKWQKKILQELEYVGQESWSKRQEELYQHLSASV